MTQRWLGQLAPGNCAAQVATAEVASSWVLPSPWQNEGPWGLTWPCDHSHSERRKGQAWETPGCCSEWNTIAQILSGDQVLRFSASPQLDLTGISQPRLKSTTIDTWEAMMTSDSYWAPEFILQPTQSNNQAWAGHQWYRMSKAQCPAEPSGVGGQKQGCWEESLMVGRRLACCPVALPSGLLPWE